MAHWTLVLTDQNFVPLGEILQASNRTISLPLNKITTASFSVRLDNPLADVLMSAACYLKAYRWTRFSTSPALVFYGPVISAEESADHDNATIAVNAAGLEWGFQHLLAGRSSMGTPYTAPNDRAALAAALISEPMLLGLPIHVDLVTGPYTAGGTVGSYVVQYKNVMDAITELSSTVGGFDWRVVPVDNFNAGAGGVTGPFIGRFEAYPLLGTTKPNAVFEWGGKGNIASYKRTTDRSTQANMVFHNTSAGPDAPGFPTVVSTDATSIAQWGVMMDVAQADITDITLRQALTDEHVAVRKNPRQTIEFVPHIDPNDSGRLPVYGIDYTVGDTVPVRATFHGKARFNVLARVWGTSFAINEVGLEQQTLQLAPS